MLKAYEEAQELLEYTIEEKINMYKAGWEVLNYLSISVSLTATASERTRIINEMKELMTTLGECANDLADRGINLKDLR